MKKKCISCNEIKPLHEFKKDKRRLTGYTNQCKKCAYIVSRKSIIKKHDEYKAKWLKRYAAKARM